MPKRLYLIFFILLASALAYLKISAYLLEHPLPQKLNIAKMKLYAAVEKRGDIDVLVFRDENNKSAMVKEFMSDTLSNNDDFRLTPKYGMWDKSHTKFWGYLIDENNSVTHIFSIVPSEKFAVTSYRTNDLLGVQPRELAVNPDIENFVYSTSAGLFSFSLKENSTKQLSEGSYWEFKPMWLNANTLQFRSPDSDTLQSLIISN